MVVKAAGIARLSIADSGLIIMTTTSLLRRARVRVGRGSSRVASTATVGGRMASKLTTKAPNSKASRIRPKTGDHVQ